LTPAKTTKIAVYAAGAARTFSAFTADFHAAPNANARMKELDTIRFLRGD